MKTLGLTIACLLLLLSADAQPNSAVTNFNVSPKPVPAIGSSMVITCKIGNLGDAPLTGEDASHSMTFVLCLGKTAPATPANPVADLSGPITSYFNITFLPPMGSGEGGCYLGVQKSNIAIAAGAMYNLSLNTVVFDGTTTVDDIGGSVNVQRAPVSSNVGPDFASQYTRLAPSSLPVKLLSFDGAAQSGIAHLIWRTASEENSSFYEVQSSEDGTTFQPSIKVQSRNNRLGADYRTEVNLKNTKTFFRLKMADQNGDFTYSRIISIETDLATDNLPGLHPNPASRQVTITDLTAGSTIRIYNTIGRLMTHYNTQEKADNVIDVNLYPAGSYFIQVTDPYGRISKLVFLKK